MGEVVLRVEDLKKTYGHGDFKTRALKGISFEIDKGEFVALSGYSGSGKSTAFHQISLLDTPTGGKITLFGEDVLRLSDNEKSDFRLRKIGYIFQRYELLPELTAIENVFLPLMADEGYSSNAREKARMVLKLVGLEERENHYPNELSGGEQQRVSIARALVKDPGIILADEPTANLDSVIGKKVMDILKYLNEKEGRTIFVINHNKNYEKYFDRIIWLKDGEIERIQKR